MQWIFLLYKKAILKMIKECNSIRSEFVICAAIKETSFVRKELVDPFVRRFFETRKTVNYTELNVENSFSDVDFEKMEFSEIYKNLLSGIRINESGGMSIPIFYLITIDKNNCSKKCEATGILYDTISLNNQPFFYFLYLDLSEIISTLRSKNR